MTMPSSGAISVSQANTELGVSSSTNRSMSSLRTLAGVASGPISMSNLYGKSNGTIKSPTSYEAYYDGSIGETGYVSWTFTSSGALNINDSGNSSTANQYELDRWFTANDSTVGSRYWIKITKLSGSGTPIFAGASLGTLYALTTNREVYLSSTSSVSCVVRCQIYSDSGGSTLVATWDETLTVHLTN